MTKFDEVIEILDKEIDKTQEALSKGLEIPQSLDKLQEIRLKITELKDEHNH